MPSIKATKEDCKIMQLLIDTQLNAFAIDLVAESFIRLPSEILKILPDPLEFTLKGVEFKIRKTT